MSSTADVDPRICSWDYYIKSNAFIQTERTQCGNFSSLPTYYSATFWPLPVLASPCFLRLRTWQTKTRFFSLPSCKGLMKPCNVYYEFSGKTFSFVKMLRVKICCETKPSDNVCIRAVVKGPQPVKDNITCTSSHQFLVLFFSFTANSALNICLETDLWRLTHPKTVLENDGRLLTGWAQLCRAHRHLRLPHPWPRPGLCIYRSGHRLFLVCLRLKTHVPPCPECGSSFRDAAIKNRNHSNLWFLFWLQLCWLLPSQPGRGERCFPKNWHPAVKLLTSLM